MHLRAALLVAASILITACGATQASLSAGTSASPAAATPTSGLMTCADPSLRDHPKCSTPPPGWTVSPPAPCDQPLATLDQVRAAVAGWPLPPGSTLPPANVLPVGDPILVRALRTGDPDEWLVPVLDGKGGAREVIAVGVRSDGRGCAGMSSGWSGPFPLISEASARARTAGPNDPVKSVEAVYLPWTKALPPSSDTHLVWRVTRMSGHEVFLFDDGLLAEGTAVRSTVFGPPQAFSPRYPVGTADQLLAGLRTDAYFVDHLRYLRSETGEPHPPVLEPQPSAPIRIAGLHKPYTADLWLVPVRDRSGALVSIVEVGIGDDGLGSAWSACGWSGPLPRVAEADARTLGSLPDDPSVQATLGWAEEYIVSPGGSAALAWLITRRSGAQILVSEDRTLVALPRF